MENYYEKMKKLEEKKLYEDEYNFALDEISLSLKKGSKFAQYHVTLKKTFSSTYDSNKACIYVIKKLKNEGYNVSFKIPNIILVIFKKKIKKKKEKDPIGELLKMDMQLRKIAMENNI
jgi:hypothetical protein